MLVRRLEVEHFRCIRRANLAFGPGLNVLFAPNDFGKSTLIEALRTALLLPVDSPDWQQFVPWGTALAPRVALEFERHGVDWRIAKTFGGGDCSLERLGEKGTRRIEARGPDADAKLREILGWGAPDSFLITALFGRQDAVTAILDTTLDGDSDEMGRTLIAQALGALAQDPIVGRLLERLQGRTQQFYTPDGMLRQTNDSPLVALANKLNEQKQRLNECEARVRHCEEIERNVQTLVGRRDAADEQCRRLEHHLQLLRAAEVALNALEQVRVHELAIDRARGELTELETALAAIESKFQQATADCSRIDDELRSARNRAAQATVAHDHIRQNARQLQETRQADLVARRDAAIRQAQAAREVIQARQHVHTEVANLAQAQSESQIAQSALDRAQRRAGLAELLGDRDRAAAIIDDLRIATAERNARDAEALETETDLRRAEQALNDAEAAIAVQNEALANAQRAASEQAIRNEAIRVKLIQAEAAERDAARIVERVGKISTFSKRLAEAEAALAKLQKEERELTAQLTPRAPNQKIATIAAEPAPPKPLARVLAVFGLRGRAADDPIPASPSEAEAQALARDQLLERRNLVAATLWGAQDRVDELRADRDHAVTASGSPDVTFETAQARLEETRRETETLRSELAVMDSHESLSGVSRLAAGKAAVISAPVLRAQIAERQRALDEKRRIAMEARHRVETASAAAASIDLAGLDLQIRNARSTAGEDDSAQTIEPDIPAARQFAVECEGRVQIAAQRLAHARQRCDELAAALGSPEDQALADAEKNHGDLTRAIEGIGQAIAAETAAAESEATVSKSIVGQLEQELSAARSVFDAAGRERDATRSRRDGASGQFESLSNAAPALTISEAENALALARPELESSTEPGDDPALVESQCQSVRVELQRLDGELDAARGKLQRADAAAARDERDREKVSWESLQRAASEMESECAAEKLLLDVLKDEEGKHAAHLGHSLEKPVTESFLKLTGGQYSQVAFDAALKSRSVTVDGSERAINALSVGTRDQLATLIRLALAAELKSLLVLDDQLVQCDPLRQAWFRERLRENSGRHQILVTTCRPLDYLQPGEIPAQSRERVELESGRLVVVDLSRAIRPG